MFVNLNREQMVKVFGKYLTEVTELNARVFIGQTHPLTHPPTGATMNLTAYENGIFTYQVLTLENEFLDFIIDERKVVTTKTVKKDGEFQVKAYDQNGKRWPECDYFTTDKEDAIGTAKLMVREGFIHGEDTFDPETCSHQAAVFQDDGSGWCPGCESDVEMDTEEDE